MLFWSGRGTANDDGYHGIGQARLSPIGGVQEWGWNTGGVSKSNVTRSFGAEIVGSGSLNANGKGRDKVYTIWIYDELDYSSGYQDTFRLIPTADPAAIPQLTIGAIPSVSTTKYVCRIRNVIWWTTTITRTSG